MLCMERRLEFCGPLKKIFLERLFLSEFNSYMFMFNYGHTM